ncbi:ADP-ribosylation factor-like protein 6-interacting protein 4 [Ostrinia nubilalis]|uniref:ADP-ribosylation factor-like protein 6-interacting protein 4 n=1 Tax=Ostrinia furnacalis TaxID=93504 RepID=UPI00103E6C47|nr:ADP-ribosylation factor-like protein 6-interacting protein 4 [Ostrinia furnacalis]
MDKKKSKRRRSSSEDSTSSSSSDSSREKKKLRKLKKKLKKEQKKTERALKKKLKEEKRKLKKKKSSSDRGSRDEGDDIKKDDKSADIPLELMEKSKAMAPMTKEEWEKRQSVIRRVLDEESGRYRLIKGDGEVLEEIVSRDRHKQINRQATLADGAFFQSQTIEKKFK